MKIHKRGKPYPPLWVRKRIKCDCGTIFELEEKDKRKVHFYPASQFEDLDDFQSYSVKCPVCKREIYFNL